MSGHPIQQQATSATTAAATTARSASMNGGLPSIYQTGDNTATWETATAVIAAGASQSGVPPSLPEDVGVEAEAGYRGQLTEPARTQLYLSQGDPDGCQWGT